MTAGSLPGLSPLVLIPIKHTRLANLSPTSAPNATMKKHARSRNRLRRCLRLNVTMLNGRARNIWLHEHQNKTKKPLTETRQIGTTDMPECPRAHWRLLASTIRSGKSAASRPREQSLYPFQIGALSACASSPS